MISIDQLHEEYDKNKSKYDAITNEVKKTIQGRSCHHKVVVLSVLHEFIPINYYLEIGVHNGTSMSYVLHGAKSPFTCIGVDLFEQTIIQYVPDKLSYSRTLNNIQLNNKCNSKVYLIRGNSFHDSTAKKVEEVLETNQLDVLFIDGLHTFEGIQNDIEKYSPYLKENGFLIIDDYEDRYPDIQKYVNTVLLPKNTYTFIGVFQNKDLILQKK